MPVELRSEKTRRMIGHIPNRLVRSGIGIISSVILILLLFLLFFPYPTKLNIPITLHSDPSYIIKASPSNGIISFEEKEMINKGEIVFTITDNNDTINILSEIDGYICYVIKNNLFAKKDEKICKLTPLTLNHIWGVCKISNQELKYIRINQKATFELISSLDGEKNKKKIVGYISKIYPTIDNNISYNVEIELHDNDNIDYTELIKNSTMTGIVKIEISNKPILKRLLKL